MFISKYILFVLSICLLSQAAANIEDHLKKIESKEGDHSFGNIDFVYLINLDERPEKFVKTMGQLEPWGINPYRFSAVNGWKLSFEQLNELGVKIEKGMNTRLIGTRFISDEERVFEPLRIGSVYYRDQMSKGSIGIILSHLSILKDAYEEGYETIWVLEDDVSVEKSPLLITELIEKLDNQVGHDKWDILFTDSDTKGTDGRYIACSSADPRPNFNVGNMGQYAYRKKISPDFKRVKARYGAYSMIVRRSGMKKILDLYKTYHLFSAFDCDYFVVPGIVFYSLNYDVVAATPGSPSDNRCPRYNPENVGSQ